MHTTSAYMIPRNRPRIAAPLLFLSALLVGLSLAVPARADEFTRGNVNGVGGTDVSDAVTILTFTFLGEPAELSCEDAADLNDSGTIDLTDAVHLLDFLFIGGAAPAAPFPNCGNDPTEDELSCSSFELCPGGVGEGLTRIPGDPAAAVAALVPKIDYEPDLEHFSTEEGPDLGRSTRDAMFVLKAGVTVGQLNDFLARESASIIAAIPDTAPMGQAVLMLRFPTTTAAALFEVVERLLEDPIVEAASPDALAESHAIPSDSKTTTGPAKAINCGVPAGSEKWKWDPHASPAGGNWGHEFSRVLQMWNFNDSIEKQGGGVFVPAITTGVVDSDFPGHPDIDYAHTSPASVVPKQPDHGVHVAGIIGARHGDQGIDGVNPFSRLVGASHGDSVDGAIWAAAGLIDDFPNIKIVNLSIGYKVRPTSSADLLIHMDAILFLAAVRKGGSALFVTASGNNGTADGAELASPWNFAALALDVSNIIVVGSHGPGGAHSATSDGRQDIEAPGEHILSTIRGGYGVACGTSASAPFVSGVAGYLLAIDPSLSPEDLKALIVSSTPPPDERGGGNPRVDAFAAALNIDQPGEGRAILKKLLNIDDGSEDGSLRIAVPAARPEIDRSFEVVEEGEGVTGEDLDLDGGPGDDRIDMSDFRRWRDWLYYGQGGAKLNGGAAHGKHDANQDGEVKPEERAREITLYPRGDFNGDGIMDKDADKRIPGAFGDIPATDLEALAASQLWADEVYTSGDIFSLVDSVDVTVSAENFFRKYGDVGELSIAPRQVGGGSIGGWDSDRRVILTKARPVRLITVPTGVTIFIASDEIEFEDDTKILARSRGDVTLDLADRGADLAVDLVRIELSGLTNTENPELEEIDSKPQEEEVDAIIEGASGGLSPDSLTHGCRAWANNQGTLYTVARSGDLETPADDPSQGTTFESEVRWQRSFVKVEGVADPKFHVKPMKLRLVSGTIFEFTAFAEISVEMRAFDVSSAWQPVFLYRAEIAGKVEPGGSGHTYRIVGQEGYPAPEDGGLAPIQIELLGTPPSGAKYVQKEYKDTIDLEGVEIGHSFEVRYLLTARAYGTMLDGLAEAYIGDPLVYGSGFRMIYDDFGELPSIDDITMSSATGAIIGFTAKEGFYAILYRDGVPVAVALIEAGPNELVDPDPGDATADDYTLEYQPIDQPIDLDEDGIDDIYELEYADILDPLDPSDARLDADGDDRSNLLEYEEGTDPTVPDAQPQPSGDLFPARVFDPGVSNAKIGDFNSDGVVDLIEVSRANVTVALGIEAGGFEVPLTSDTPEGGFLDASLFTDLDGDGFLDIVIADLLEARLQVLIGDGLGGFTASGTFATGRNPERLTSADVDGDGVADVLTANTKGHSVSVLLGTGDGSLEDAVDTPLELSADPRDVTAADMDGDGVLDLVVGVQQGFLVSIFPGNGDGTFGAQRNFPAAFIITRVGTGDVNGDGALDVVTTSGTTHVLSVFLGNGDGTLQDRTDYSTGRNPADFCLADLDDDGDLDIVVGHAVDNHHGVLLGEGDGTFTIQTPAYTTASGNCLLADFTGDGRLDLLSPGYFISEGLPGGRFDTRVDVTVEGMYATDFTLADVNDDGWMDVVLPNRNNHAVELLLGADGGDFTHAGTTPVGEKLSKLVAAHLDDDTAIDLAVITERPDFFPGGAQNQLYVLLGDGSGEFTAEAPIDLAEKPTDIFAGDIDGDGLDDLLVAFSVASSIAPFINQGEGQFAAGELLNAGSFLLGANLGDLNGDQRDDVVLATSGGAPRVLLGDASGELVELDNAVPAGAGGVANIRLHDVTGDGALDLVGSISQFNAGTRVVYHEGNGDGSFAGQQSLLEDVAGDLRFLSIVDVDGDGNADISAGRVFRLADPAGGWSEDQTYWNATQKVYDVDRDGRPDRLAVSGDALEVLYQR